MCMSNLAKQGDNAGVPDFDPSQFKLQPDGTFRISIRGMAAMAGVDFSGLARTLRSAVDENPLPCARSLLAQGFCPVDLSSWGETGGIPEAAAPFILEYYGINAASPSARARAVLLAFTRVGINAYLKERLGIDKPRPRPASALSPHETLDLIERSYSMLERLGVADDRDRLQFGDMVRNTAARAAGGLLLAPADPDLEEVTLSEAWLEVTGKPLPRGKGSAIGKLIAEMYREEFGEEPPTRRQFVDGAPRSVKSYVRRYLHKAIRAVSSRFLPAASEAAD